MGTTARVGLGDTTLRELSTPQACRLLSHESQPLLLGHQGWWWLDPRGEGLQRARRMRKRPESKRLCRTSQRPPPLEACSSAQPRQGRISRPQKLPSETLGNRSFL